MAFNIGPFHPQAPHFIVQLSCKACQQVHSVMVLFARNHQFHWEEARHLLSVQVRVISKYLLQCRQKNLALSLQTGLRMKRPFFLKLGLPHSESCEELHKEKKSRFGMTSILCIKKGAQRARARYSRLRNNSRI